jgi:hypothetical protein
VSTDERDSSDGSSFSDRAAEPVVAVHQDVAIETTDPPQQDGREDSLPHLLAIRLDSTRVRAGERTQRQNLPSTVVDEPIDVALNTG